MVKRIRSTAPILPFVILLVLAISIPGAYGLSSSQADIDKEKYPGIDEFVPIDVMPEMIQKEIPLYPARAEKEKIEGAVWLKALIDKAGKVVDVRIHKSSGRNVGFEEAAVAAAYKCKFKAALQSGKPVAVWVVYKVDFSFEN
jgi:TonB family protein